MLLAVEEKNEFNIYNNIIPIYKKAH